MNKASLTVENFSDVKMVDVVSTTKGKGFQGVVKRWNFEGSSIPRFDVPSKGRIIRLCQWPGRVF